MFQTLTHIIRSIQATLGIILGGARPQLLRIETGRSRRAVSFIEYALLAGAAVLLVTLLSSQLRGIIQDLLNNLRESILG
jgi:Flp pilus assembly pilin Flp